MKNKSMALIFAALLIISGCASEVASSDTVTSPVSSFEETVSEKEETPQASVSESDSTESDSAESDSATPEKETTKKEDKKLELTKNYKAKGDSNPIMTQAFGADPYALVYDDTVYIYMTADAFDYDSNGEIIENNYSKIRTIHCVSTKDMKNFEDHGEIKVAGSAGAAKWAHNSWAPAAAHKVIDGKDKFFLYFADNGGGIGVLTADSPIGPFTDPIGKALISRSTPNCANVEWLFDPAVLVDDDGTGYIYFGGGVPQGKISAPGTGRVCKLGADMISLDGDPIALDVPYLFEDSGIHKFGNKYYYTYCTNWNVDDAGTKKYGFTSGNIAMLESDNPMGPFTYAGKILDNPGTLCGLYGNNHHAIFEFNGTHYIVYHSRLLEKNMGVEHNYRATFVNKVNIKEDGSIGTIAQSKEGVAQLIYVNPYEVNSAVCVASMAGTNSVPATNDCSYGIMKLGEINTGDYTEVTGVDFGDEGAAEITITADIPAGVSGTVYVRAGMPHKESIAIVSLDKEGESVSFTAKLDKSLSGVETIYFVFEGEGFYIRDWKFSK